MWKSCPQGDGVGGGTFVRWLGHEGGALMKGISAFIRRDTESSWCLPPCKDAGRRRQPGRGPCWPTGPRISDVQTPELGAIHFCCLWPPACGILLQQPEWGLNPAKQQLNKMNYNCYRIYIDFLKKKFSAALGLCCCAQAFSSCGERGLPFVEVHGLLIAVASLVAEHGL